MTLWLSVWALSLNNYLIRIYQARYRRSNGWGCIRKKNLESTNSGKLPSRNLKLEIREKLKKSWRNFQRLVHSSFVRSFSIKTLMLSTFIAMNSLKASHLRGKAQTSWRKQFTIIQILKPIPIPRFHLSIRFLRIFFLFFLLISYLNFVLPQASQIENFKV